MDSERSHKSFSSVDSWQTIICRQPDGEEVITRDVRAVRRRTALIGNHICAVPEMTKSHALIIDPLWRSKLIWDSAIFVSIAYQVMITPVELAFVDDHTLSKPFNAWWFADFVMGLFFVVDLLANCMTAYMNEDGFLVVNQWSILIHYLLKVFDAFTDDRAELNKKLRIAQRFMSDRLQDRKVKNKVMHAIRSSHAHQRDTASFKDQVEPLLSEDLRHQLHGQIYAHVLHSFPPFYQVKDGDLCSKLAIDADEQIYSAEDLVVKERDMENSMVFVVEGQLLLHSVHYEIELDAVCENWFFGERCIFADAEDGQPLQRRISLFALRKSILLKVDGASFRSAVKESNFNAWWRQHMKSANDAKEGHWGCPACQNEGHWLDECEVLVPFPSIEGEKIWWSLSKVAKHSYSNKNPRTSAIVCRHVDGKRDPEVDHEVDMKGEVQRLAASVKELQESLDIQMLAASIQGLHDKLDALVAGKFKL